MRDAPPLPLSFRRLVADDLLTIERQPSQRTVLGIDGTFSAEEADMLACQRIGWTLRQGGRILACFGIMEPFPGVQGVAWALLGEGIGAAHLAMTRFAAMQLAHSGLARVEVLAKCAATPENFDHDAAMRWAMAADRITPECRWARMVGLRAAHVLHRYGAQSETHMLFEWFGGAPVGDRANVAFGSMPPVSGPAVAGGLSLSAPSNEVEKIKAGVC